jgi:hypothetical protein
LSSATSMNVRMKYRIAQDQCLKRVLHQHWPSLKVLSASRRRDFEGPEAPLEPCVRAGLVRRAAASRSPFSLWSTPHSLHEPLGTISMS